MSIVTQVPLSSYLFAVCNDFKIPDARWSPNPVTEYNHYLLFTPSLSILFFYSTNITLASLGEPRAFLYQTFHFHLVVFVFYIATIKALTILPHHFPEEE